MNSRKIIDLLGFFENIGFSHLVNIKLLRNLSDYAEDIKNIINVLMGAGLFNEPNFQILCEKMFDADSINEAIRELAKIGLLSQKTFTALCKVAEHADDIADLIKFLYNPFLIDEDIVLKLCQSSNESLGIYYALLPLVIRRLLTRDDIEFFCLNKKYIWNINKAINVLQHNMLLNRDYLDAIKTHPKYAVELAQLFVILKNYKMLNDSNRSIICDNAHYAKDILRAIKKLNVFNQDIFKLIIHSLSDNPSQSIQNFLHSVKKKSHSQRGISSSITIHRGFKEDEGQRKIEFIHNLKKINLSFSHYLLGLIFSGELWEADEHYDIKRAEKYFEKIPSDTIWYQKSLTIILDIKILKAEDPNNDNASDLADRIEIAKKIAKKDSHSFAAVYLKAFSIFTSSYCDHHRLIQHAGEDHRLYRECMEQIKQSAIANRK